MSSRRFLAALLGAALGLAGTAGAQTDSQVSELPEADLSASYAGLWLIGLLAQTDDNSNRGAAASLGYGVGRSTWLNALLTSSGSPSDRANINTNALILGIDHRFEHVGLGFEVEDWGDSGTVESKDYAADLSFFTDRFQVTLGLERRDIDITFSVPINDRILTRKVPLDADGWSLGLTVSASDAVRLFYDYNEWDYSRDLRILPRIQQINLLNSSALTLANSFLSEAHTFGVDLTLGDKILSLTLGDDTSAVDETDLQSFGLALIWPVARRIDLEFSIGRSDSDFFESSTWGGVGILIYGGS